jgi:hypothetical protein
VKRINGIIVRITNSSIAIIIAGSNANDTNNDNDCGDSGGVGLSEGWP